MHVAARLTSAARALRLFSVLLAFVFVISMVLIGCVHDFHRLQQKKSRAYLKEREPKRPKVSNWGPTFMSTEFYTSARALDEINVETTNVTVVLENVEVDTESKDAPWMFTNSTSPFVQDEQQEMFHAHTRLSWNGNARGNGSCGSGGSGKLSRGYVDPFNNFLGIDKPPDYFGALEVELRNLSLVDFLHVNTVDPQQDWGIMGEAGDMRRYAHGSFKAHRGNTTFLLLHHVQWIQNTSYPWPVGEAHSGDHALSGYFVGEIQDFSSDEEWIKRLDPHGVGYVLGVLTAASLGEPACFTSNSYWISLRGFPPVVQGTTETAAGQLIPGNREGAKTGFYTGSSEDQISSAKAMSSVAKTVTATAVGSVVGGAVTCASISVVAPATAASPPGRGLARLLAAAAFVAKLSEVRGFHTDAMQEFGKGLRIFIGKVPWPGGSDWMSRRVASLVHALNSLRGLILGESDARSNATLRQDNESDASVSDQLFGGCAFYTTLVVIGFLFLHTCVWLATRKKPVRQQLAPHAWMIYMFSIIMSHVYSAAVLNSVQYLRSHTGKGTGKAGLYLVAVFQLLFIGVGFTVFFMVVMILALKRVLRKEVKWIPRRELADPDMRRSAVIMGEYKGGNNTFHALFECYYGSLIGPRVWLACMELAVIFLDAICTAVIWNEVVCLAVLVCMYAFLFGLFLLLAPFVDRIEGSLVLLLAVVELITLILEFIAAVGDYDTAESMEFAGLILGFIAIGIAVLIAVYCDLIPILCALWSKFRQRFVAEVVIDATRAGSGCSDMDSDWSGISRSVSDGTDSGDAKSKASASNSQDIKDQTMQIDPLVEYNSQQEREVRDLLTSMFGDRVTGNRQANGEAAEVMQQGSMDIADNNTTGRTILAPVANDRSPDGSSAVSSNHTWRESRGRQEYRNFDKGS